MSEGLAVFAMQYSFLLPADYDMGIIDRRIAERGHSTDHFGGLKFKAYLVARQKGGALPSRDNLYAPFYVWDTVDGFHNFVCGEGFGAPSRAFGRPQIKTWMVWDCRQTADLAAAKFATRSVSPIEPHDDLGELRRQASARVEQDMREGALASVSGFEPTSWSQVHFQLRRTAPAVNGVQSYEVAHLSLP